MKNIVIIGASGHAKVIIDIIERTGTHKIVGLVDSYKDKSHLVFEYKVLGTEDDLPELIKTYNIDGGIIAIGDNFVRMKMYEKILARIPDFNFISAIHPSTLIGKNVEIGSGSVALAGVFINSDARIGKQCIINTKSSVGHESIMDDFSSLSPGVTIGGNVHIGFCSAICLGANVIESIHIGKHTVIGAGSLVTRHIGDQQLAFGIPLRDIRKRKKDDFYLGNIYKY